MLGPINALSAYSTTALQPVGGLTREGVQAAQPVQPAQPIQPAPAVPAATGAANGQQGSANQQPAAGQPDGAARPAGQQQAVKPGGQNDLPKASQPAENNRQPIAGLTREEQALVAELVQSDHRVRAHEQAHISAGGNLIRGGPSFEYQTGPDKQRYAVSGEVSIDTTPVSNDPPATIRKAEHIRRAALAPADPSSQDLRVAADATHLELQAQAEERQAALDKQKESSSTASTKQQKPSSPVLDAMLKKAYETALGKTPASGSKSVLGIFSA
jgi:hypothetical protein